MIDDIISSNNSVQVTDTYSNIPYVNANMSGDCRAVDGDVRYNNTNFEIFYNGCWTPVPSTVADVRLYDEDRAVLDWAKEKMRVEQKEKELLEKHPGLKSAKEKYDFIKALVENE